MPFRKTNPWGRVKPPAGAAVDWGDPISRKLVAYWIMNEGGGPARDIAGKNNTVASTSAPTWTLGKFGKCLAFNGTNQYLDGGTSSPLSFTGDFGASCWIKPAALTDWQCFLSKYKTGINLGWDFFVHGLGQMSVTFRSGTASDEFTNNGLMVNGVWKHIIITQKASTTYVYLYVNAVLQATFTAQNAYTNSSTGSLRIGARDDQNLFSGSIDNVRLYNRFIQPNEVLRLYVEPFAGIIAPRRRIINRTASVIVSRRTIGPRVGSRSYY